MIHLNRELQDHGQAIAELTTTMNQLAKAQLQQTQASRHIHDVEGIHVLGSEQKMKGNQRQPQEEMYQRVNGETREKRLKHT